MATSLIMTHPLKAYRLQRSLSQAELARMLKVYPSTIMRWENGARKISEDDLPRVSEATGIAAAELRPDLAALLRAAE